MKVFLLHQDKDFNLQTALPSNERDLTADLELSTLFDAMALGDKFILDVVKKVFLSGLTAVDEIEYRQDVLKDCLKNPAVIRSLYQIPLDAIENKHRGWLGIFSHSPASVLSSAVDMMAMFVDLLRRLRSIADEHADQFESEGFSAFFRMIKKELDEEYFAIVENHLRLLKFKDGVLISAELGKGNEGTHYTLRLPAGKYRNWIKELLTKRSPVYSFIIPSRDDAGARAISDIKDMGVNLAANALAQATDHIDSFLKVLRVELAFYIGCINLYEQLTQAGSPVVIPVAAPLDERKLSFRGLYDVCLALTMKQKIIGNDIRADQKSLFMITGANQGGKSTFLRSVGLAQLMMQAGMFVPAEEFSANVCQGVFTHYKRKEDTTMKSGKLDEELSRMSVIVDTIVPNALMLFNESFAATNEREGSEIARQITSALVENHIKVFFVTHQYEFARAIYAKKMDNALFLRADRKGGGGRTFKLIEAEPLPTSYGQDIYRTVFEKKQ